MFRIVVLTNRASSDLEAQACDKAQYLLELFQVHHQIVDGSVHPEMCQQLLQVSGAVPVFPQFYLKDEQTNEVCILGELSMIERMLEQGVLPGQKDPTEVFHEGEGQNDDDQKSIAVKRSQSMRSMECRSSTSNDDAMAAWPTVRATQSMKPLLVRDSSFGMNDTKSLVTIELNDDASFESDMSYDADTTENSYTELVLLEDEPSINHEVMPARSPFRNEEQFPVSSTGYMRPPNASFRSNNQYNEAENEIRRIMQQDFSFHDCEAGDSISNCPDRFITPAHSFNLPVEQAVLDEPMAPKAARQKLQLDFNAFMLSGGSFRQKLVRGHSLLQSDPGSRSTSFCSKDGLIRTAPVIQHATMVPPPPPGASSVESRGQYVTPKHSFVACSSGLGMPRVGGIEPNVAPQATRAVISIADFERCALPGADNAVCQIARGNSLLASSNSFRRSVGRDNSSFCRSVTRGISRYATDDSLCALKEEVKVDKIKRITSSKKKTVQIFMSDDDEERLASPRKPTLFGLVRKSSIKRPVGASKVLEGSSSHHTKTTVDVSSSEENSEGASFGDSGNNEDELSITGSCIDSNSVSSTEFEEQEDSLPLHDSLSSLKSRSLSFVSTQSWSFK